MPAIDLSSVPSDQRPINLRYRPDLVISESRYQGERCWIVKDPVGMQYFRLQEPEYEILMRIDGTTGYRDLKHFLDLRFPERSFKMEDIQSLVISFHQNGFLHSENVGQDRAMRKRRNKKTKQKLLALFSSVLALRFPGVDPERFLSWLYPKTRWFFTRTFFVFYLLFCGAALTLVLGNIDEFTRRLPEFQSFFGVKNLVFMGAILIVTKSIHELGHGMMCKHFGGECHEIGFMLLVLTPAMYCNTSDSWILSNKWHRMAIGAAGMYVEVFVAAIATFLWWYTEPGWLHYLCLNVMFLCSVSTLLFNANPLLRYDGYFILADFLEIPNLAQKSRLALLSKLRVLCLGMKPINSRLLPQRGQTVFAIYSVASFCYRWFVLFMILFFLSQVFKPWGLEVVGHTLIAISLIGLIVVPLFKLTRFFMYPGRTREVKKPRLLATVAVASLVIAAICLVPVPHDVYVSFVVQPGKHAQPVYVTTPGSLKKVYVKPGDRVVAGKVLADLKNYDIDFELAQLEGERSKLRRQLTAFMRQPQNPEISEQVPKVIEQIESLDRQIDTLGQQVSQLSLIARRDGTIIPPPNLPHQPISDVVLPTWDGSPLDPENHQAFLPRQVLFCTVGDPAEMRAVLVCEQSDVSFLQTGQPVTLMFDEYPSIRYRSEISEVSSNEMRGVPRELSQTHGGPIAVKPGKDGSEVAMLRSYEAFVPLGDLDVELRSGFRGRAKVRVGSATLGWRTWRYIRTVIKFR